MHDDFLNLRKLVFQLRNISKVKNENKIWTGESALRPCWARLVTCRLVEHIFKKRSTWERPCISRNQIHTSCGSKSVPLAETKSCLSRRKIKRKHIYFSFPRGTAGLLAEAKLCLPWKEKGKKTHFSQKIFKFFCPKAKKDRWKTEKPKKTSSKKQKTRARK